MELDKSGYGQRLDAMLPRHVKGFGLAHEDAKIRNKLRRKSSRGTRSKMTVMMVYMCIS